MNTMKKFVGKVVIRNKPFRRNSGMFSGEVVDRSYMNSGIRIEKALGSHAYYRDTFSKELCLLPSDYCDENWEEVGQEYAAQLFHEGDSQ